MIISIMAFPFTIKYSKSFSKNFNEGETTLVLTYIQSFIRDKAAKNIQIADNCLSYKGSTSGSNWNIFSVVDKGVFKIIKEEDKTIVSYEFSLYHLFIFVSVAAALGWIYMKSYGVLIGCFGWLGGMNWIISFARHRVMFNEITDGIDNLVRPAEHSKTEKENESDDKLK